MIYNVFGGMLNLAQLNSTNALYHPQNGALKCIHSSTDVKEGISSRLEIF